MESCTATKRTNTNLLNAIREIDSLDRCTSSKCSRRNLGNIVIIEPDFEYKKGEYNGEGIELPEVRMQKIGYNNKMLRKKNLFENEQRPVLLIKEGENKSRLENIAAIRRKAQGASNSEK